MPKGGLKREVVSVFLVSLDKSRCRLLKLHEPGSDPMGTLPGVTPKSLECCYALAGFQSLLDMPYTLLEWLFVGVGTAESVIGVTATSFVMFCATKRTPSSLKVVAFS